MVRPLASTGTSLRIALAGLATLFAITHPAAAAGGVCDGTISSQALKPLPAGVPFDVDIYDNSEENLAFRDRFLAALKDAGLPTTTGGPLMITVISERLFPRYRPDVRDVGTPTTSATVDNLGVNRTRRTIEGLERAPDDTPGGGDRRFEQQIDVRFEVRDSRSRDFVWLGQLSCSPTTDNRSEIIDSVLDAFTKNVGQRVTDQAL